MQTYIEDEKKIQTEIDVTNFDVLVSRKILNFQTPPPVIRPAIESVMEGRFVITDLLRIKLELQGMTDYNGYIDTIDLLNTFNRFVTSADTRHMFPASFQSIRPKHVEEMVHNFDPKHKGKILTSKFLTILALQNSKLPSQKELESYQRGVSSMSDSEGLIKFRDFEEVRLDRP